MRSVLPVIFALGLAASVSAASAQTTPAATTPTTPAATTATTPAENAPTNNDDIVSCRYEKSTGSLFAKRICHTQREWHQMTVDSRDMMDNINAHDRPSNGLGDSH